MRLSNEKLILFTFKKVTFFSFKIKCVANGLKFGLIDF